MNWEFLIVITIVCATATTAILRVMKTIRRISDAKAADSAICDGACSSCVNSFNKDQTDCEKKP